MEHNLFTFHSPFVGLSPVCGVCHVQIGVFEVQIEIQIHTKYPSADRVGNV